MSSASVAATEQALLLMRVKQLEEQHSSFRDSVVCAFNQLHDLKDINTGVHSTRLAEWALRVARKLDIPEKDLYQVEVAALMHDVGKIGVPDAILKNPPRSPRKSARLSIAIPNIVGRSCACSPDLKKPVCTLCTTMRVWMDLVTRLG